MKDYEKIRFEALKDENEKLRNELKILKKKKTSTYLINTNK